VPPQLHFLGRAYPPFTDSPPFGVDGQCDEHFDGKSWRQISLNEPNVPEFGSFLATGCYDPTTKLFFLFGNTDYYGTSEAYDPASDTWSVAGTLPNAPGYQGQGGFAWCVRGTAFIFGGFNYGGDSADTTSVLSYVTTQPLSSGSTFTKLSALTSGGSCFGTYDPDTDLIFVGGGNSGSTIFDNWYSFDPNTLEASALASLPTPLYGASCAYISGHVLVIGGSADPTGNVNAVSPALVYDYDIVANTWSTKGSHFPVPSALGAACTVEGIVYCACGYNASGFPSGSAPNASPHVYSYDAGTDSWSLFTTMEYGAGGSVLASVGEGIGSDALFFGGA
jgi:N-acetylneuraminic acid mutarotase